MFSKTNIKIRGLNPPGLIFLLDTECQVWGTNVMINGLETLDQRFRNEQGGFFSQLFIHPYLLYPIY